MYRYVVVQEFGWKPRANHDFLSLERQMEILHKDLKPETKKPVVSIGERLSSTSKGASGFIVLLTTVCRRLANHTPITLRQN